MRDGKPTVVSTFSGCGGSSLGYHLAGCKVLLAVEWDDNAVETYRMNFPSTPVFHGDIGALTVERARELAGLAPDEELDIFDGSPPCQGFSTSKRGGRDPDDARNFLFREYVRLLSGLRPRGFIMENVKGMVMGQMMPIFDEVMRELRGCGYRVKARVLNAKWYGVPQSRERVIFIGIRDDLNVEPTHPAPTVAKPVTVREAFRGVVIAKKPRQLAPRYMFFWRRVRPGRSAKDEVMLRIGNDGWFGICKVHPDKPANTIVRTVREDGFGAPYHWEEPRVLAIEEVMRLASFPDDFRFTGNFEERWARIGNCVPPLLMKAVASNLRDQLATAT